MEIILIAKEIVTESINKFVGFYVTNKLWAQLNLLSISKGTSKSTILRNMLFDLLDSQNLENKVAEKLYESYKRKTEPWSNLSPTMFSVYARNELVLKKVSYLQLEKIFKEFKKLVKKESKPMVRSKK